MFFPSNLPTDSNKRQQTKVIMGHQISTYYYQIKCIQNRLTDIHGSKSNINDEFYIDIILEVIAV